MHDLPLAFAAALALVWLGLTIAVRRALRALPLLGPPETIPDTPPDTGAPPLLSVIVPARNEEGTLAAGLESILSQRGVAIEVVVVNDHSSDRTGEIADAFARRDARVRVLHNPELPEGWLGKTNALHQGVADARGEFILFTDADIIHRTGAFATATAKMHETGVDLLTLLPSTEWVTVWENAIVPGFFLGAMFLAIGRISDPESREAAAAGAFILVRADTYRRLGRHEPIRNCVLDDVQLARLFKHAGCPIAIYGAPRLVHCRMYHGNRDAFWAFTKNILDAMPGKPWWLTAAVWPLHAVFVAGGIGCAVAGAVTGSPAAIAAGLGVHLFQYATFFLMRDYMRFDPLRVLLFPVAAVSMGACLLRALYYRAFRGSVVWRGRETRVRPR